MRKSKKILKGRPGLIKEVIPKGTYRGMNHDVTTVGLSTGFVCRPEIPTDDVYKIIKALFSNKKDRDAIHPKTVSYDIPATLDFGAKIFKSCGIPFHPGVKKYLKEIGKWSKELESK